MLFEIEDDTYTRLSNISCDYSTIHNIPVLDANESSYINFFQNYMLSNIPCIIRSVTNKWQATQSWCRDGKVNYEFLRKKYGANNVTVYKCLEQYYNSHKTYETTFDEYLDYFQRVESQVETVKLDYLKNWHLQLNSDDNFYEVPIFFASDWLNEYYVNCLSDDYRFVYIGPKKTWTPFHADVFSSYSWSANVYGKKKWLLFPPGEEDKLKDNFGNLPYDITQETMLTQCFEVIQESGEAIFVPSGWHHQVWNLEDTISINHNWVNGCNIEVMFNSMISNFEAVKREIEDCVDMENYNEHCQIMLNAAFGIDFYKFYDFLKFISLTRISMVEGNIPKILFHGHELGKNHILFDIRSLKTVLAVFVQNEEIDKLKYFTNVDIKPLQLLEQLVNILENQVQHT